jgi:hypothetical protein
MRDWELEKYKGGQRPKYICPQCQDKGKTYVRYINARGEYAPFEYGRCERASKCNYHIIPGREIKEQAGEKITPPPSKPQEYLDFQSIDLKIETQNNLFAFMAKIFGESKTLEAFKRYYVATKVNKIIFPYIDDRGRLTQFKTIEYNQLGKRTSNAMWQAKNGLELRAGTFGAHLLEPDTIPHIVEGEKTALICSIVYPKNTWLAVGGLNNISKTFHFKEAVIYPDKGKSYEDWRKKCPNRFIFDQTVEESPRLEPGEDLADLILESVKA